ncbi:MAG: putative nucleotidyltransferase substrate binding domain-containing protein [Pseudomonadota bacterium]
MADFSPTILDRLTRVPPFNHLPVHDHPELATLVEEVHCEAGATVFDEGAALRGIYVIEKGAIDICSGADVISHRGPGDLMGERGLLRDGCALLTARSTEDADLLLVPADSFFELTSTVPEIGAWFGRSAPSSESADSGPYAVGLMSIQVSDLMTRDICSSSSDSSARDVARLMREKTISSVLVMDGETLKGIVTVHDLVNKVLAAGIPGDIRISEIMTPDPVTISPEALGLDAMMVMAERRISHLPVANMRGNIVGLIGRTDLFRQQNATASFMGSEIVSAQSSGEMAKTMARLPELLKNLTSAGARPVAISRRITDLTDAATRRLLVLAEETFGPPPVPYLWVACGSQGRREQTGISDQDNCLILSDAFEPEHDTYFASIAKYVSDGLNDIGYVYCPGDMMATNPRWRQPRRVWARYFSEWIGEPDEEAQMLASVMFDLRPIAGDETLFTDLQEETLEMAMRNSIFLRHMISNSLKHQPPLGVFRGLSLIRTGKNKNTIDLKMAGVVPITDLGRIYALKGGLTALNTPERIRAAGEAGIISEIGARDLLDAYDFISETRLEHQAAQIARGEAPDNFLDPATFSELERNHLRDAFLVVKTMQSALGSLF